MNIPQLIRRLKQTCFNPQQKEVRQRERFLTEVIETKAFQKLSTPDKVLSLGKLITIFRRDFGYIPKKVEKTFDTFNQKLNDNLRSDWDKMYH